MKKLRFYLIFIGLIFLSSLYLNGLEYINLFVEIGQNQTAVDTKINSTWSQLFYGNDSDQRVYYPVDPDMAYMLDTGNNDVRSEGMSYGMMICVQLNQQIEFNRLWNWAKNYMQHQSGDRQGYFAWQCSTAGNIMDQNPAPDGEEYFAMALYFAWQRWGNGSGIYDYKAEADNICYRMLHQGENSGEYSSVTSMFNADGQMDVICFVPYASASTYTDPSYHLPAFYELFALWADQDNSRWDQIADRSRSFFPTTINSSTGLGPDYANYNGSPYDSGDHEHFEYDAWRTTMNIAVDQYWWGSNSRAVTQANSIQNFFGNIGVSTHGNRYTLSGTERGSDHSPGLVAMNACASLISTNSYRTAFIQELWDTAIPSGQYRYYDGLLYTMGLLHCSGQFRMNWGNDTPPPQGTPMPTLEPTPSPEPGQGMRLEAEDNDANSYNLQSRTDNGCTYIYNISYSHWLQFNNVSFNTVTSFTYRYADEGTNGYMSVRLDNNDSNSEIAHVIPPDTGAWTTFAEDSVDISAVTGDHTVYLYFHDASQNIYLDWIEFGSGSAVTPVPSSVPGNTSGDVNSDEVVDIVDALLVAQYYVGLSVTIDVNAADVNCDSKPDIVDALLIAQYYVGLITTLDC